MALSRLRRSDAGTAMLEFALAAPFLMTIGLFGAEAANRAVVQLRVNQLAVLIADNASRIGENSLLGEVKIYESDINDILLGAEVQAGEGFDLYQRGRVIISSLEVVPDTEDQQYIHWQRCAGVLEHASSYGEQDDGRHSELAGMGPAGEEVYAYPGEAVMFVELAYTYRPIITAMFSDNGPIVAIATFNVRNNRDLSGMYQRDEFDPAPVARCSRFEVPAG